MPVPHMVHTRFSTSPSSKSKSDSLPKQKMNKKFKTTLNTKKTRPAVHSDSISTNEASMGSTSNIATL